MSKPVRKYYHLNSSNFAGMPSNYTSIGENNSSRRYALHKFYEGTVNHDGRDALFFLQKRVSNNEELSELMNALAEIDLARRTNKSSENNSRSGNEQFEKPFGTEGTFRKHNAPQNLRGKSALATAQAIYQRFTEDAVIFVPGYVMGVSVNEHNVMISQIETISLKEQPDIEIKLRAQNLKGALNFW